ncbi:MAG: Ig-like domain-containing protein, partial [Cyclobacteriaceae bacterium]|nr:Ig-like domain-containing protein [Cyclobacteriaceae bacterium]
MMKNCIALLLTLFLLLVFGCNKEEPVSNISMQLSQLRVGGLTLNLTDASQNIETPVDQPINGTFTAELDPGSVSSSVTLRIKDGELIPLNVTFLDNGRTFSALPNETLQPNRQYELIISNQLRGKN